jgi:FKBP-type peptidyl-prolyl cis-trans isomerase
MPRNALIVLSLCITALVAFASTTGRAQDAARIRPPADDKLDVRSYSIGFDTGRNMLAQLTADGVTLDQADFLKGMADALGQQSPEISEQMMYATLAVLEQEVRDRFVADRLKNDPVFKALHDENLRRSSKFLESFAKEDGVDTLPNGVLRRVLVEGNGDRPAETSRIIVSFRAKLLDDYTFGEADYAEFRVNEMLPGARDIIMQMREGDHWYVAVPPTLGFGPAGRPPDIGPNEVLLINVKLITVRDD